jgi:hypothetical protein
VADTVLAGRCTGHRTGAGHLHGRALCMTFYRLIPRHMLFMTLFNDQIEQNICLHLTDSTSELFPSVVTVPKLRPVIPASDHDGLPAIWCTAMSC